MNLPIISIATSIRYGNYKEHYAGTQLLIDSVVEKFSEIREKIILPRKLFMHFRPIRDAYGRAFVARDPKRVYGKNYIIELDARQDYFTFTDTLLHELVHIEQFYQRRLTDGGRKGCFKWKGKHISFITPTREAYDELPWEAEAIERAKILQGEIFLDGI
jgi:hypothetical protein